MAASVWKKWINLLVGGTIRFKKNSGGIDVVNSDGTVTTVTTNELAKQAAGSRLVSTTATALSLTQTQHADRILLINTNSTVANTFTMPEATGSGNQYEIQNNIAQTQGSIVIAALTTDVLDGRIMAVDTTAVSDDTITFATSATSDKITLNLTTQGGLRYDTIRLLDVADATWRVSGVTYGSGNLVTPFSAT